MFSIVHKVGVRTSTQQAYDKLSNIEGLAGWWATDTTGTSSPGGTIHFRFGDRGKIDVEVLEQAPGERVVWQVLEGPGEWIGSQLSFELKQAGEYTNIFFQHRGWKSESEGMHHCSTKWAMFLMSLKQLLETGRGAAFPNDVHISGGGD